MSQRVTAPAMSDIPSLSDPPSLPDASSQPGAPSLTPAKPSLSDVDSGYGLALRDRVLSGFRGELRPVKVPPLYHIALLVVAAAMVLLPGIYLALIGLTGWAVYEHAVTNVTVFDSVNNAKGAFLVYTTPIFVGIVAIVFLVKPLFAPRADRQETRSLSPQEEPILFAFVERLCKVVGAPVPSRIDVDSQVNASASFRQGMGSMLGNDLVLTIGLPLARGLTLQQFAGVLAHEFGHFAQGAGMRLSYVVRSISAWFARVVYQRDAWDERLEEATEQAGNIHGALYLMLQLARGMVWLSRRVLWLLMHMGHGLSCFLLRQMEFDADRYEARLAGAGTFSDTSRELAILGLAHQKTMHDLSLTWQDGRLADSLPDLIVANRGNLSSELVEEVDQERLREKTKLFDTHPADADRIAGAAKETDRPVFQTDLPATALFRDFRSLAVESTQTFYQDSLGESISVDRLLPVDQILARSDREISGRRAFWRFVSAPLDLDRGLQLGRSSEVASDIGALAQVIEAGRREALEGSRAFRRRVAEWEEVFHQSVQTELALEALEAGLKIEAKEFGLDESDWQTAERRRELSARRMEWLDGSLGSHEEILSNRMVAALAVLDLPALASKDPEIVELCRERDALMPTARAMAEQRHRLAELRLKISKFLFVANHVGQNPALRERFVELTGELQEALRSLVDSWQIAYPFESDDEPTLADWILAMPYGVGESRAALDAPADSVNSQILFEVCQSSQGRCYEVYGRVMARLAAMAERGERELGFEPFDEPEDESSEDS